MPMLCVMSVQAADDAKLEAKVNVVFNRMSQADKAAELQGIRPNELMVDGKLSPAKCRELIPNGIGQVCQFGSSHAMPPEQLRDFVRELQHWLMTETPARVPAIFHEEALTGFPSFNSTVYPQAIGMGCTWNTELAERKARATAETFRAAGSTLALSPMLDLCRTAHWPRLEESFGEDAYLMSVMGLAFVRGMQGDDLRRGVATTGKHFAGYGIAATNRQEFFEEYLMPHEVITKLGDAQCIMPGYHSFNGEKCIANRELLTDILRGKLGFSGLVVSDYGAMMGMRGVWAESKLTLADKMGQAADCINAGSDVELAKGIVFPTLPLAVEQGKVSQQTLDAAVKRSLRLKARLGLLDGKIRIGNDSALDFDPPTHRKIAYEAACQSLVLLKNDGVLPLTRGVKKIALVGPNSASFQALLGDYTYQSLAGFWWGIPTNPEKPKLVNLLEGLRSRAGDCFSIFHERGCDWAEPFESKLDVNGDPRLAKDGNERMDRIKQLVHAGVPRADWDKALAFAAESDVIIAAMGENQYLCGEGRERKGIRLPGKQEEFVKRLLDTGKPVVLVLFGGRQQVIDTLEPRCAAVVQAWFPGEEGGNAVADLLLGNFSPSGKLCVSYPLTDAKGMQCYNEGYATTNPPLYPFGYGLTYTRFEYRDLKLPAKTRTTDGWFTVSFKVKNVGECNGAEVAQLYIAPQSISSAGKVVKLQGFERVELRKGQERKITLKISPEQLANFRDDAWVIEPGEYEIRAAASATDIRLRGTIELTGEKRTLQHRTLLIANQK